MTVYEIERKWRIENLPSDIESYPSKPLTVGYLKDEHGKTVRVRQEGDKYFRVQKSGQGVAKDIGPGDAEITKREFDELWPRTAGWRIWKTRYYIPYGKYTIELDVYRDFPRFYTVEVEFETVDKARQFVPPDWFGKELTNDTRYANSNLALNGLPNDTFIPEYGLSGGVVKLYELIGEKLMTDNYPLVTKPVIVQVAGGSASGKTSQVALKIKELFGSEAVVISMDDYYHGDAFMKDQAARGNVLNWDQPKALDLQLHNEHLLALQANLPIQKPIYDFKTGERTGTVKVFPAKVVIVEGLFALDDLVLQRDAIKVFVDIGFHGRILRRLLRDVERTGQSPAEILEYFARVVEPMYEKYVQSTRVNANIIINNEYCPAVEAQKSGIHEVQLKFRTDLTGEDLRKKGVERLGVIRQVDYYYNPKDRNLADSDEALRIRSEGGRNVILTYKGPRVTSEFSRKRPKFEFEIDVETMKKFLLLYGWRTKVIEKKDRELYCLDGVIFSLDSVYTLVAWRMLYFGRFLEVRSTNASDGGESRIKKVLEKLGLDITQGIKESYFEMLS